MIPKEKMEEIARDLTEVVWKHGVTIDGCYDDQELLGVDYTKEELGAYIVTTDHFGRYLLSYCPIQYLEDSLDAATKNVERFEKELKDDNFPVIYDGVQCLERTKEQTENLLNHYRPRKKRLEKELEQVKTLVQDMRKKYQPHHKKETVSE